MHTNTTRATQNTTFPRRNTRKPQPYQHILSNLTVEANQLKTPVSPTTPTKTRNKNNTKCPPELQAQIAGIEEMRLQALTARSQGQVQSDHELLDHNRNAHA